MIKYVVYPGTVRSDNDRQRHYIPATELMRLYRVNPDECIVYVGEHSLRGFDKEQLIELRPRYDGNYQTPV